MAADTKERILETALERFAQSGYRAACLPNPHTDKRKSQKEIFLKHITLSPERVA